VLLPLLAAEGATLLNVRRLLTVHAFIGMFLVPVVALKLVSTGWRMMSYYRGTQEYVLRGPPHVAIRLLVAPALVASTVVVFGTGIALLVLDRTQGTLVGLHKASFVVWAGAFGLHLLTRVPALVQAVRVRPAAVRVVAATVAVAAGVGLAVLTLPAADHLQDNVTVYAGFDDG
jgi:predicted membrane channel-forming protein YqfA (hemolysin III family)